MRLEDSEKKRVDFFIMVPVFTLLAIGALLVYTSSSYLAQVKGLPQFYFLMRHFLRIAAGIVVMVIFYAVDPGFWAKHSSKIFWATVTLLVLLFFLGKTAYGARRWISFLGFSFQPSDLAKLTLIIWLSAFIARRKKEIKSFKRGFLPGLGAIALLVGLVLVQPDLSTSALLALVGVMTLFFGGVKPGPLLVAGALAGGFFFVGVKTLPHATRRVQSFLGHESYQVTQAKIGLAEGGLLGVGPGRGKEKFLYLPKPHTDFIYAVVGEELGLWGSLLVLFLLMLIVIRGMMIANRLAQKDRYLSLMAYGASALIGVFGLAHMSVVIGLLPPTGLALPFLSYGGSSLMAYSAAAGLLLNISKKEAAWRS